MRLAGARLRGVARGVDAADFFGVEATDEGGPPWRFLKSLMMAFVKCCLCHIVRSRTLESIADMKGFEQGG